MKKMVKAGLALLVLLGTLFGTAAYLHRGAPGAAGADTIFLLLPDSIDASDPAVQEWLDAADEEGLHLEITRDSSFLDPMLQTRAAGLIIPDQLHREANDALIGALNAYVRGGGKLMLVYDACTWDLSGHFPELGSRLSDLAGVNYALYSQFGKKTMEDSQVWGTSTAMDELEIPPGQFVPMDKYHHPSAWREVSLGKEKDAGRGTSAGDKDEKVRYTFVAYKYGDLPYPSFRTSGEFDGKVLLESSAGLVAGVREHGQGNVLFVNLPLGYLESRTDGLLLHSFLRYFALHMLRLPSLATVPDGVGGLVLNWHVDAESAIKSLVVLRNQGVFNYGPFSIHVTAGPDVDYLHDGKGLNVNNSPEAQKWIQFFRRQGDEVGSHGGWIHNYFGENVSDDNQAEFEQFLALNKSALDRASGQTMTEYSAPLGNQPEWVTRWLAAHGFVAYYFAGDAGMGPTLVYRDHGRDTPSVWAFPILHLGLDASLEEMNFDDLPDSTVQEWLMSIADFTSQGHVARLVYSHPLGATRYIHPLLAWLAYANILAQQNKFRWYTMTSLAEFLDSRREVQWTLKAGSHNSFLEASHPKTLDHQTWILPMSSYGNPRVTRGKAQVRAADGNWFITAGDCSHLQIKMDEHHPAAKEAPRS